MTNRRSLETALPALIIGVIGVFGCDHDIAGPADGVTLVASGISTSAPVAIDQSGHIFTWRVANPTTTALQARTGDGAIVWERTFTCPSACASEGGSISLDGIGNIYVVVAGTKLVSVSAADGHVRWSALDLPYGASVATGSNGRVYLATPGYFNVQLNRNIEVAYWAVDAATGAMIWTQSIAGTFGNTMVIDESRATVYFLDQGGAVALDAATGSLKWKARISGYPGSSGGAIASDGTIYVANDGDMDSHLNAFTTSGEVKFLRSMGFKNGTYPPVVGSDGAIYVTTVARLTSYSPTGVVNWQIDNLSDSKTAPVVDRDNTLYIIAKMPADTTRYVLAIKDGEVVSRKAQIPNGARVSPALVLASDGRIYYVVDGSLYSFASAGYDPSVPWPTLGHDAMRTFRK